MLADWVSGLPLRFQWLIFFIFWLFFVLLPLLVFLSARAARGEYNEEQWEAKWGIRIIKILGIEIDWWTPCIIWLALLVILWFINPAWFAWVMPEIGH